MIQTIEPGPRYGSVNAPSSKSMAHRHVICAALGTERSTIFCPGMSRDIEATIACLNGLGAQISVFGDMIEVIPILQNPSNADSGIQRKLFCGESGSTLRFLLPVTGAMGENAVFPMEGRLPERPMAAFETELCKHGMQIRREGAQLFCSGQLEAGTFVLPGNISSQYFSGLLFALPLLTGESRIVIEGTLESEDYLHMTEQVLTEAQIRWKKTGMEYRIPGEQQYLAPQEIRVEGDYSGGAFFLCAGAISGTGAEDPPKGITVGNLFPDSGQGDRRVKEVLEAFGANVTMHAQSLHVQKGILHGIEIDASMIPDLIPVLSVVASVAEGESRVIHGERLRMKESDRIQSTVRMLQSLGADVRETEDGMIILGKTCLDGGVIDPSRDHRIAMAAAIAACVCRNSVTVLDAECVEKSYPDFWNDLGQLACLKPADG